LLADRTCVNSRLRVSALVGLGVLVLGAGGFLVLGQGSASSSAPVHQIKPLHPVNKQARARAKAALAPPKLAMKMSHALQRQRAVIDGVPTPLADALKHHGVVVLALVTPKSVVDQLTLGEAKAGAAAAHAGFVTINVSNNAQVAALSALVGSSADPQNRLLDAPAVLVFQQPRTLYVRLNGYSDANTVQQAAVNAEPAPQT
jgi:hypothetical protein